MDSHKGSSTVADNQHLKLFRTIFIAAAIWNLAGAILGYFNTAYAFQLFFDRELLDPLVYTIYKGAWGTTFVYFFGYLIVSYNPVKHSGIVIIGGIGKIGYVANMLQLYADDVATRESLIVIVGDSFFIALFIYYFLWLYKEHQRIV
jgi:hypothetical protein